MCLLYSFPEFAPSVFYIFRLLLIGGAADLETSDFAKVAKIFYHLALKVSSTEADNLNDPV